MRRISKAQLSEIALKSGMPPDMIKRGFSRRRQLQRYLNIMTTWVMNLLGRVLVCGLKSRRSPSWNGVLIDAPQASLSIIQDALDLISKTEPKWITRLSRYFMIIGELEFLPSGQETYARLTYLSRYQLSSGKAMVAAAIVRRAIVRRLMRGRSPLTAQQEIRVRAASFRFGDRFYRRLISEEKG